MKKLEFDIARGGALVAAAFSTLAVLPFAGCSGGSEKPASIASEERVNEIVEMRKIFDSVKGDWDSLSAEDKEKYTKLAGGADKAQTLWKNMGSPMGATPSN